MAKMKKKVKKEKPQNQAEPAAPTPPMPQGPTPMDTILQLQAQLNATKQLADEFIAANINMRARGLLIERQLDIESEARQKAETENATLKTEIENLTKQLSKLEKVSKKEAEAELQEQIDMEGEPVATGLEDDEDEEAAA